MIVGAFQDTIFFGDPVGCTSFRIAYCFFSFLFLVLLVCEFARPPSFDMKTVRGKIEFDCGRKIGLKIRFGGNKMLRSTINNSGKR